MQWFVEDAPIRLKLLLAFGSMMVLTAVATMAPAIMGAQAAFIAGAAATAIAIVLGLTFRSMIADPYVATVVRMEGLAAGDLATPIDRVRYQDCVGRLTRAMTTFKDAAAAQIEMGKVAAQNAASVQTMSANMRRLADGDLTAAIVDEFPAEYAELKNSFNAAIASLSSLVANVNERALAIGTGSQEVAQASEDLARRTESNAASLEETSAALVQIETRLRATATSAKGTVARADEAIASVGTGRTTAEDAMAAMDRVSVSAKGIDSVIEGVDKIAFQTRVLAMNAAVEAGRAGDAGRGFAVVADLVSALAMRAEEEAKRARDQLTVTQAEIVSAVDAVRKVDGSLADISGDVDAVHALLASMADDNLAQSTAITQISSAVGSMDKATQQNAAMVEETSAAARNLTVEVSGLMEQAGQFRIGTAGAAMAAPPVRKMPVAAIKPINRPTSAVRRAANDPPKAHANGATAFDSSDWSNF